MTIFGASAGGSSVTFLMASPLAEGKKYFSNSFKIHYYPCTFSILGLFSKAIALSGTNIASWSLPPARGLAREKAKKMAEHFDCYKPNDWSQSIDCLRKVPAANITAATYNFFVSQMI